MHHKHPPKKCSFNGCDKQAIVSYTECALHGPGSRPCVVDGCSGRVSKVSKAGVCSEHYSLGPVYKPEFPKGRKVWR